MSEREATELDEREALLTQNQFPLGSIPKGWKVVKLNKTLSKVIDNRGKTPPFAENGAHELIEIASLRKVEKNPNYSAVTKYVSADVFESWFRDHIKDDDILVSTVGSVGLSALIEEKRGAIAQNLIALRTNELCDARFLFNWTRSSDCHRQIRRVVMDAVQPSLKLPHFLNCFVHLPPLPEQRKIASILTTVDNLIEQTEALIEKYKSIKQGMMHDLFTRGVDSTGQLRPSYEDAPELYKESELGWIPKEWEVTPLQKSILKVKRGPSLATNLQRIGVRYLTSDNITPEGLLDWSVEKHLNADPNSLSSILQIGDVLLNCVNSEEQIGKTGFVSSLPEITTVGFNNFAITFDTSVADAKFAYWQTSHSRFQMLLRQTIKPAINQVSFSSSDIHPIPIVLPTIQEQEEIAARLDSVSTTIASMKHPLWKLNSQKSGLMQDLLTGKVRVNVDETEEVTANV